MDTILQAPRQRTPTYAPRIVTIKIHKDKVREVIDLRKNYSRHYRGHGVTIDVEDNGTVVIAATDEAASQAAVRSTRANARSRNRSDLSRDCAKIMDFEPLLKFFLYRWAPAHFPNI
jgi:polyribonucleotide nucleotidyltransferase